MTLKKSHSQALAYLVAFILFWLVINYLGVYPATAGVLLVGTLSFYWQKRLAAQVLPNWQAVLFGLLIAEVFFALGFWSTLARNKALIMIVILFLFSEGFDRIELKWLAVFALILLGALLLVPFQVF